MPIQVNKVIGNWISAALGAMVIGTTIGWSSTAEIMLSRKDPIDEETMKGIGYALCNGAYYGAILSGPTRRIGYRRSMIMFELIIFFSWMFIINSELGDSLYLSRWIQGVGVGGLCAIIPSYIGEISQPHIRGNHICSASCSPTNNST